jgi:hypothetical protein
MDSQSKRSRFWVAYIMNIDSKGLRRDPDEVFAHHSRLGATQKASTKSSSIGGMPGYQQY